MALFDRVDSGFPELDEALDYFRIGDNVVCRLTELDDFRLFAEAFAKQGVKDGRNVVYVRFAEHAPLLGEMEGVTLTEIPPSKRFEWFTVTLHELIQSMPEETYYIFDCLSDLQTARTRTSFVPVPSWRTASATRLPASMSRSSARTTAAWKNGSRNSKTRPVSSMPLR